jgi:hypothetical protein
MNGAVALSRLSQSISEKRGICFTCTAAGLRIGSSVRRASIAEWAGSENCSSSSGHGMSVTVVPAMVCLQKNALLTEFYKVCLKYLLTWQTKMLSYPTNEYCIPSHIFISTAVVYHYMLWSLNVHHDTNLNKNYKTAQKLRRSNLKHTWA